MATTGILGFQPKDEEEEKKKLLYQPSPTGMAGATPNNVPLNPFENLSGLKTVTSTGTQPAPIRGANLPQGFQFTGSWADKDAQLRQQESDAGAQRSSGLAALDEDYNTAIRKATSVQEMARKALLEKMAAQGTLHSGVTLDEQGKQDTKYQDYLNDLNTQRARGISGIESDYASVINQLARTREGFFGEQQREEEARRLEEAKVKAETERLAREQAERQAMLDQILAQQEAARIANEQALAAARYRPPEPISFGGGDGGGGGGGGDYYEEPPAPAPAGPDPNLIVLPHLQGGQRATQRNIDNWIRQNVDPWISGNVLNKVREVLMTSPQGVKRSDLGWLIQHESGKARNANRGGMRVM